MGMIDRMRDSLGAVVEDRRLGRDLAQAWCAPPGRGSPEAARLIVVAGGGMEHAFAQRARDRSPEVAAMSSAADVTRLSRAVSRAVVDSTSGRLADDGRVVGNRIALDVGFQDLAADVAARRAGLASEDRRTVVADLLGPVVEAEMRRSLGRLTDEELSNASAGRYHLMAPATVGFVASRAPGLDRHGSMADRYGAREGAAVPAAIMESRGRAR